MTEQIENVWLGYCGVDCLHCPDHREGKCPSCRKTEWPEDDPCPPVGCCRKKKIPYCAACDTFPCAMMAYFYEESDGHRQARIRMEELRPNHRK